MALGAEMARPFPVAGGSAEDEVSARAAAATAFVAAETTTDRPVDPLLIWGDEKQMKRELVAWAKAVAAMAATTRSSPWPCTRHGG
jgi:hypothetical protein